MTYVICALSLFSVGAVSADTQLSVTETVVISKMELIEGFSPLYHPKAYRGNPVALIPIRALAITTGRPEFASSMLSYMGIIGGKDQIAILKRVILETEVLKLQHPSDSVHAAMMALAILGNRGIIEAQVELEKMTHPGFWSVIPHDKIRAGWQPENHMAYEALLCYTWAGDEKFGQLAGGIKDEMLQIAKSKKEIDAINHGMKEILLCWKETVESQKEAGLWHSRNPTEALEKYIEANRSEEESTDELAKRIQESLRTAPYDLSLSTSPQYRFLREHKPLYVFPSRTSAEQIYHESIIEGSAWSSTLSVRIVGKGTVSIGEGKFTFPRNSRAELLAKPAPGWIFRGWQGTVNSAQSPRISVDMKMYEHALARFEYEPDLARFDLVSDLDSFLMDIGYAEKSMGPKLFEFDTGDIEYVLAEGKDSRQIAPNSIADVAEIALLQTILRDPDIEMTGNGGVSHSRLMQAWKENIALAQDELSGLPDYTVCVVAAYMTMGSWGHREVMPELLLEHYNVSISDKYETGAGLHDFGLEGDADNDGTWNVEEWGNALKLADNNNIADMEAVNIFTFCALEPETSGGVEKQDDGTFTYKDEVIQIGSEKHKAIVVDATGADSEYLSKGKVTLVDKGDKVMSFDAYVTDPPGFESVPLPKNTQFVCALGRELRLNLIGDAREKRHFRVWQVSNTMIDGSNKTSETLRLGNPEQIVSALRRSGGSKETEASNASGMIPLPDYVAWEGVGLQKHEVKVITDKAGNKYVTAPEWTYVEFTVPEFVNGRKQANLSASDRRAKVPYPEVDGKFYAHIGWVVTNRFGDSESVYSQLIVMDPRSGWFLKPIIISCDAGAPDPSDKIKYPLGANDQTFISGRKEWEASWREMAADHPTWWHILDSDEGLEVYGAQIKGKAKKVNGYWPGGLIDHAPALDATQFSDNVYYSVRTHTGYQVRNIR